VAGIGRLHPRKLQFEIATWYDPGGSSPTKAPSGLSGRETTVPVDDVRTNCLVEYISGRALQALEFTTAGSGQRTIETLPTIVPDVGASVLPGEPPRPERTKAATNVEATTAARTMMGARPAWPKADNGFIFLPPSSVSAVLLS